MRKNAGKLRKMNEGSERRLYHLSLAAPKNYANNSFDRQPARQVNKQTNTDGTHCIYAERGGRGMGRSVKICSRQMAKKLKRANDAAQKTVDSQGRMCAENV